MLLIQFSAQDPEVLVGLLSAFPFEGYQEFEGRVEAYIDEDNWARLSARILSVIEGRGVADEIATLPELNWNAEWESSFQPVEIDRYCAIRASFHTPMEGFQHELVIDPKMAFGTGHHETTQLMVRLMKSIHFLEKTVLDLGCGTGVLGILAARSGASAVYAVDNDPEAIANTKENAGINLVRLETLCGELCNLGNQQFDVILANINRNVLMALMSQFVHALAQGGTLVLSGILMDDDHLIRSAATDVGLVVEETLGLGEWEAMILQHSNPKS